MRISAITASVLLLASCKPTATDECQDKHPNNRVRVIEGECHYKDDFGWIKSGKTVLKIKDQRSI